MARWSQGVGSWRVVVRQKSLPPWGFLILIQVISSQELKCSKIPYVYTA